MKNVFDFAFRLKMRKNLMQFLVL